VKLAQINRKGFNAEGTEIVEKKEETKGKGKKEKEIRAD